MLPVSKATDGARSSGMCRCAASMAKAAGSISRMCWGWNLLGWVVDILEVLQTNALDPTQGVAAANGNSSWPEVAGTRRDSSVAEVHQMHRSADEFAA